MRVRPLLLITAIVSSILGAIVVYLVLTVPNDLQAGALLKTARKDIAAGRNTAARESLSRIVQEYPRTDAAAAATVALVKLGDEESEALRRELDALERASRQQAALTSNLQRSLEELKNAPKPEPVVKPAPEPTPKKKAVRPRTTRRRRR